MDVVAASRVSLGSVLIVVSLFCLQPGELIGGVLILLNVVLLYRCALGADAASLFDESCFLASVVVAYFVTTLRAGGEPLPENGYVPSVMLQIVWCALSCLITAHARFPVTPGSSQWIPLFLSFGCGALVIATFAKGEPFACFVSRVSAYLILSQMLFIGRDFGPRCIIGSRGFLPCFYAVMFVGWPLACLFSLVSLLVLIHMDHEECMELDATESYAPVQVAPSDVI
jgi:hypothetical protein